MNVLIRAELINPPTWFASFRDITLYIHVFMHCNVLLEALPENTDLYFHYLKERAGGMDFVDDFVEPGIETGYRIDSRKRKLPMTVVVTDRIIPENIHDIISRLNFWIPRQESRYIV